MLNQLSKRFLTIGDEFTALTMLKLSIHTKNYNIGRVLGKFFSKICPTSYLIKDEYATCCYFLNNLKESYRVFAKVLNNRGLNQQLVDKILFNQHFSINTVSDQYAYYNPRLITKIMNRSLKEFPTVTFTITSCKRFDLFENTVNSFLNACIDLHLIDKWICVDDNSSDHDRDKMKKLYPFFEYVWKDETQKGHPRSMNIIRNMVKTPYIFHMEDDWKFFCRKTYISDCMEVLNSNTKVHQCLINKNYAETESDISIAGGLQTTTIGGLRYYIHEMVTTDEDKKKWTAKYGENNRHCNYWPHYSFRPSLFRKLVFELGEFDENVAHFEMDYSGRYVKKGYMSAFLEGIYCLHTGRLTSERHDKTKDNAYTLNNETQFTDKKAGNVDSIIDPNFKVSDFGVKMKFQVLNLDRRPDRFAEFEKTASLTSTISFDRFSAVDGNNLVSTPQLQRIFDGNDYNMRAGIVGCAMSHILMYTDFIKSDFDVCCIVEDDVELVPNFDKKLQSVLKQVQCFKWDILYLGHHLFNNYINESVYDKKTMPIIEKWDVKLSLRKSMGGTGGYLISKAGAIRILEFINKTGMTNGIDTVQQKAADNLNIFYSNPHLIYSECCRGDNTPDTDIQHNHISLTVDVPTRLVGEIAFYDDNLHKVDDIGSFVSIIQQDTVQSTPVYYECDDSNIIRDLCSKSKLPYYTLDDKIIIVVPPGNKDRYFNRLKKGCEFNVDDAIKYK